MHLVRVLFFHSNAMKELSHHPIRNFYTIILVVLLSEVALCVDLGHVMNQKQNLRSIMSVTTKTSVDTLPTNSKNATQLEIELTSKTSLSDGLEKTTRQPSVSHDNIPNSSGLPEHSTDSTTAFKATETSSVFNFLSSSSSTTSIGTSIPIHITSPSTSAVPVHRKSKPEETHVDDILQDSGPTTDYVVPLVVAMLAVPLVGVLCALLCMKGRDFWERRHYGRIDFLWDSRYDMDFLIDGMYRE